LRSAREELQMVKRKEFLADILDSTSRTSIFSRLETRFNPQRWFTLYALARAARLGDFFVIDGGFEWAHERHSYFSSLVQRVFR